MTVQGSAEQATYVELCFPPPASFTMNGSQPCLNSLGSQAASLPSTKVSRSLGPASMLLITSRHGSDVRNVIGCSLWNVCHQIDNQ